MRVFKKIKRCKSVRKIKKMSRGQTADWTDTYTESKEGKKSVIQYKIYGLSDYLQVNVCVKEPLLTCYWYNSNA